MGEAAYPLSRSGASGSVHDLRVVYAGGDIPTAPDAAGSFQGPPVDPILNLPVKTWRRISLQSSISVFTPVT